MGSTGNGTVYIIVARAAGIVVVAIIIIAVIYQRGKKYRKDANKTFERLDQESS